MRTFVLVDIDHVLSNAFHRDPMIGNESWDAYHAASINDEPIKDIVDMINCLGKDDFNIVAITARPEKWRNLTMQWMVKHKIHVDELLMRPDDLFHPAPEIKTALALARFTTVPGEPMIHDQVAFLLDDRADVCEAFHALGITTMQVRGRRDG